MKEELREIATRIRGEADAIITALGDTLSDSAVRPLAVEFCKMNDDQQAQFFVEVARIMDTWGAGKRDSQAWYIGRHLATCRCSTPEAREFVSMVADSVGHAGREAQQP